MASNVPAPERPEDVMLNIRSAREELLEAFAGLSDEQMTAPGPAGGWSIKDHLAHIAEWQRRGLGVIAGIPPWEAMRIDRRTWEDRDSVDPLNEVLHQRNKDRPLDDVLLDFHETHQRVEQTISAMTEEELQRELPPEISSNYRRVVDIANSNFARHDRDHINDVRALAGR